MENGGILNQSHFTVGFLEISSSILTTWLVMLLLTLISLVLTRSRFATSLNVRTVLESVVTAMRNSVSDVLPDHTELVFPFISTLWVFILAANLVGLIPGLSSPTSDLSVTTSLAILTFLSVHWFGIRAEGLKSYLGHYLKPSPFLLPFQLLSEVSRTIALAVRLFGNIMSLEFTALLVVFIAGFLVPIPILMLHIIEAVIQAYIFGILALMYIAGGIQAQVLRNEKEEKHANDE